MRRTFTKVRRTFFMTQALAVSQAVAIEIRPADWRDLWGVWRLEQACFGPDAWGWFDLIGALVTPSVRLKAQAGKQLVGFIIGERHFQEGCAWIATLGVLPEFQRRGVGARLLAETEARLNTEVIKLTVRESNAGAIALYQRFGYKPARTIAHYYVGGETGIVMHKVRMP